MNMPSRLQRTLLVVGAVAAIPMGIEAFHSATPSSASATGPATRAVCTLALDDYQSEVTTANKFTQIAFDYEGEILPAYKAGQAASNAQVQAITRKLAVWNLEVSALADQARRLNPRLKSAVATCELLLKAER